MQFTKVVILVNFSRENWIYIDSTHISKCILPTCGVRFLKLVLLQYNKIKQLKG